MSFRRPGVGLGRRRGFRGVGGGAAAAAAFTPTSIASLTRWWNADAGVTGTAPITAWTDQVASAVLTVRDGSPDLVTLSGKLGIKFVAGGGNNDSLTQAGTTATYTYLHDGTGGTICLVLNNDASSAADGVILGTQADAATSKGLYLSNPSSSSNIRLAISSASAYLINATSAGGFAVGSHYVTVTNGSTGVVRVDGTGLISGATGANAGSSALDLVVGARPSSASRFLTATIRHILFFNAVLSGADLTNMETWMAAQAF